ncbi:MAG TPA: hypothetical protein VMY40_14945 [Anaerolineae bacterium]|nr:hypothetical protein [Anaerolineae bacterium]
MSNTNERPQPIADAFAIIGDSNDAKWIKIGPVWENRDGSQTITIEVEPIAWRDPTVERRVQIRKREPRNDRNDRGRNDRNDRNDRDRR